MQIERMNSQLRVTWPRYPKPTHEEIIRRLKSISGAAYDREHRCWWVPLAQGDKLMAQFPKASYSVDAIWTCTDAEAQRATVFYESLVSLGVTFEVAASGAVCAVGEGVSPFLQQLVQERAPALRALVLHRQKGRQV
jgi:hypothetical protein